MSEKSLFNVACKLLGLWLLYRALAAFVWAFLVSRYPQMFFTEPPEAFGWYSGAVSLLFGIFLCCRSGWLTQRLFEFDGPLDTEATEAPLRRLFSRSITETGEED